MASVALFALYSAMLLALAGAFFGVCIARLVWADDLKQAQRIDAIRSRTEVALRGQIAALEKHLAIYQK